MPAPSAFTRLNVPKVTAPVVQNVPVPEDVLDVVRRIGRGVGKYKLDGDGGDFVNLVYALTAEGVMTTVEPDGETLRFRAYEVEVTSKDLGARFTRTSLCAAVGADPAVADDEHELLEQEGKAFKAGFESWAAIGEGMPDEDIEVLWENPDRWTRSPAHMMTDIAAAYKDANELLKVTVLRPSARRKEYAIECMGKVYAPCGHNSYPADTIERIASEPNVLHHRARTVSMPATARGVFELLRDIKPDEEIIRGTIPRGKSNLDYTQRTKAEFADTPTHLFAADIDGWRCPPDLDCVDDAAECARVYLETMYPQLVGADGADMPDIVVQLSASAGLECIRDEKGKTKLYRPLTDDERKGGLFKAHIWLVLDRPLDEAGAKALCLLPRVSGLPYEAAPDVAFSRCVQPNFVNVGFKGMRDPMEGKRLVFAEGNRPTLRVSVDLAAVQAAFDVMEADDREREREARWAARGEQGGGVNRSQGQGGKLSKEELRELGQRCSPERKIEKFEDVLAMIGDGGTKKGFHNGILTATAYGAADFYSLPPDIIWHACAERILEAPCGSHRGSAFSAVRDYILDRSQLTELVRSACCNAGYDAAEVRETLREVHGAYAETRQVMDWRRELVRRHCDVDAPAVDGPRRAAGGGGRSR